MRKSKIKPLIFKQAGFSHHTVLAVIVVAIVAVVGVRVLMFSYAATPSDTVYIPTNVSSRFSYTSPDISHYIASLTANSTNATQNGKPNVVNVPPTIASGSTGGAVRYLQKILGGLTQDGVFGSKTLAAVKSFQTFFHLPVDGVVGPQTWTTLFTVWDAIDSKDGANLGYTNFPSAPALTTYQSIYGGVAIASSQNIESINRVMTASTETDYCLPIPSNLSTDLCSVVNKNQKTVSLPLTTSTDFSYKEAVTGMNYLIVYDGMTNFTNKTQPWSHITFVQVTVP